MLKSILYLQSLFIAVLLLALSSYVYAFDGIPSTLKVIGKDLVLNGAGVKTKFFQPVYSIGLYLEKKIVMPSPLFTLIQRWQSA